MEFFQKIIAFFISILTAMFPSLFPAPETGDPNMKEYVYTSTDYYPGTEFETQVYIPTWAQGQDNCALIVQYDNINATQVEIMERLYHEGAAPACIFLSPSSGHLPPTLNGARHRGLRMNNYDLFTETFPNFLVEELIPALTEKYDLSFSDSPDMHAAIGASSGGAIALNTAWTRNDYFHRIYMASPSTLAMGKANELTLLVRKSEPKPIRIYMEYGEDEPDSYFGSSQCVAWELADSLAYAGYAVKSNYFPGEGHGSRYIGVTEEAVEGFRYLWQDWETEPVTVQNQSDALNQITDISEQWQSTEAFPAAQADSLRAVSPDGTRLYEASESGSAVYAYPLNADGAPGQKYFHAYLHTRVDFDRIGAYALTVDSADRIYAATEAGINVIDTTGATTAILALPGDEVPTALAFDAAEPDMLYAKTENGVYCRRLRIADSAAPLPLVRDESKNEPAVGEIESRIQRFSYISESILPDVTFDVSVYVPEACETNTDNALVVHLGGVNTHVANQMDSLAAAGDAPAAVQIGVAVDTPDRAINVYNAFTDELPKLIVNEIIPAAVAEFGLSVSPNADLHMIGGASEEGFAAMNAAWWQSGYFHRVYLSSPAMLAIENGNNLPYMVRKTEPKDLRVYIEYGENEPVNCFGSVAPAAFDLYKGLIYAGYDAKLNYFPGEGHCSRYQAETAETADGLRFLWQNYATEPVAPKQLSEYTSHMMDLDSKWEAVDAFPKDACAEQLRSGNFSFDANNIYCLKSKIADGYQNLTAVSRSSDRWRLYAADSTRGCVYSYTILWTGKLQGKLVLSTLHTNTVTERPGAFDIAVDSVDRVFVATEAGVQCVRSFGLSDTILTMPNGETPLRVTFGGKKMQYLYVQTENGVYRRKMLKPGIQNPYKIYTPENSGYYD